jgi:hypothetical protein
MNFFQNFNSTHWFFFITTCISFATNIYLYSLLPTKPTKGQPRVTPPTRDNYSQSFRQTETSKALPKTDTSKSSSIPKILKYLGGAYFLALIAYLATLFFHISLFDKSIPEIINGKQNESGQGIPNKIKYKEKLVIETDIIKTSIEREFDIIPNTELVQGNKGKYYIINLTDSISNKRILFKSGRYVQDEQLEGNFISALNKFRRQVLENLESKDSTVNYKLFVLGSADIRGEKTWKDSFDSKYKYNNIQCYKYIGEESASKSQFSQEKITRSVVEPIKVKDLPNLRAAYTKEKFEAIAHEFKKPELLDGRIYPFEDKNQRNAILILFTDWTVKSKSEIL